MWWKRVCTSIFGMIVVDAMNVHQACVERCNIDPDSNAWITGLAHELINNTVDAVRLRSQPGPASPTAARKRKHECSPTLTPNKRKCKQGYTAQGRCKVCRRKSTETCRACTNEHGVPHFVGNSRRGRECFKIHCDEWHN